MSKKFSKSISTRGMPREEWLELRRKSIGGSDAAAILGLNKWSSPYSVWADKTGRLPEKPDTEAMRIGRDLEDYVARRWMEVTGKAVKRVNQMLYNTLYPFAHADIDRGVVGERAGLECKTTSTLDVRQFNGVEFPEQYYVQCVHYLAVTGYDRWYLGVLVLGRGFFEFTLERDQAEIDALMKAEAEFWVGYVETDTPPPTDGKEATSEALQAAYKETRADCIDLVGRSGLLDEYQAIKKQMGAMEERLSEIANEIKSDLQDAERGSCGNYNISWKPQIRPTFQTKAFAQAYPNIDLTPFYKFSNIRPFKVTEKSDATA